MTSRSFVSNTNDAMVLMICHSGTILHFNENHIMAMVSVSTSYAHTKATVQTQKLKIPMEVHGLVVTVAYLPADPLMDTKDEN